MSINLKNSLINFSVLITVSIFCFFLFEIMVRLFFPSSKPPIIFDEIIGYKYAPSSVVTVFREGEKINNKTNSIGFLDEEHHYKKLPGIYRIVFLGDSFTEAVNVLREKIFPEILEKELNKIHRDKIEIINLGKSGFGTAHEYLALKEYGLKFSPDLVVLNFFIGNDIENNYYKLTTSLDPGFNIIEERLVQVKFPTPLKGGKIRDFISDNLQSPRFLVYQFSKLSFLKNLLIEKNFISATKDLKQEDSIPFQFRLFSDDFNEDTEKPWQVTQLLIS